MINNIPADIQDRILTTAKRLAAAYGDATASADCRNTLTRAAIDADRRYDPTRSRLSRDEFVLLALHNAELRLARDLRRAKLRRDVAISLDELTLPPAAGADIAVRHLPPSLVRGSAEFYRRLAIRDSILANTDVFADDELQVALLWLRGHSARATFQTLGIPSASGYRRFAPLLRMLKEAVA